MPRECSEPDTSRTRTMRTEASVVGGAPQRRPPLPSFSWSAVIDRSAGAPWSEDLDVRCREVVAHAQDRTCDRIRQSVREAVSQVQRCRMAALPVSTPSIERPIDLETVDRHDPDVRVTQEPVHHGPSRRSQSRLQHDAEFQQRARGDDPLVRGREVCQQFVCARFVVQDGHDRRGVDHQSTQLGRPARRTRVSSAGRPSRTGMRRTSSASRCI